MSSSSSRLSLASDSGWGAGGIAPSPSLLCVPLVSKSIEQMLAEMRQAKSKGADIVEIRLDHLTNFHPRTDLEILLKDRPLPALITYRPKWEGGQYEGDENTRFDALRLAMELGADYVDIELKAVHEFMRFISGKKSENAKLIISSHDYQKTPSIEELGDTVVRMQASGADIVKIATMATDITDVARMFQILVHCQDMRVDATKSGWPSTDVLQLEGDAPITKKVPMIGLVISERGVISRLLCPKFGGYLTFCTLDAGKESAPGQPTLKDLLKVYNIRQIRPDTKIFGIIGKPVSHSKGPILHNEAFRSVGFNAVYVPLLVDDLENFLKVYSSPDFAGFSCSIPHKEAAARCCDEVDPIAKAIGAVNTIIRRPSDGKLIGYNTDYTGAISAIEDGIKDSNISGTHTVSPLAGRLFVVIGAGGAGKALAYGAKEKGARVVIANRTYDRARELANLIGAEALSLAELDSFHPENGMILANTTSMGMQPNVDETPISKHALTSYAVVFDAVYTPRVTRLLREAESVGATTVSGVEMFIRQAMGQFELFTGLPAPKKLMQEVMERSV